MPDYSEKKETKDLRDEIDLSDDELINSDETSGSEISELSDVPVPDIEKIKSYSELIESKEVQTQDLENSDNSEVTAEENLKTDTEEKTSDQIVTDTETADKPDSSKETVIKKTDNITDLTEDEMEMKIKEIVNSLKKF